MPKTKLLIEQENKHTWRVVVRECTERGLSSPKFGIIADNMPQFEDARDVFDETQPPRGRKKIAQHHHNR